jgi:hypothetical protein
VCCPNAVPSPRAGAPTSPATATAPAHLLRRTASTLTGLTLTLTTRSAQEPISHSSTLAIQRSECGSQSHESLLHVCHELYRWQPLTYSARSSLADAARLNPRSLVGQGSRRTSCKLAKSNAGATCDTHGATERPRGRRRARGQARLAPLGRVRLHCRRHRCLASTAAVSPSCAAYPGVCGCWPLRRPGGPHVCTGGASSSSCARPWGPCGPGTQSSGGEPRAPTAPADRQAAPLAAAVPVPVPGPVACRKQKDPPGPAPLWAHPCVEVRGHRRRAAPRGAVHV